MKKILSLLALLVMTLTAFATDYTGHRTVTFGSLPSTESDDAVLTITDNGDNTFNVTFKDVINVDGTFTDNYGTYTFSNVAGTTENGVTTIDLSNLSASVENCSFYGVTEASEGVLFAKFNAEKAYARFSAKIGWRKSTISAEFGVDDFESTGGGEPGGEDKPAIVDVVEEGFKATGSSWKKEGVAIDWDTQYIAAKLDLSTCKTSTTGPENVLAVGTDITGWNNGPHYFFYYNKADKVLQYNYLHSANSSYNRGFANLSKAYIQLTDEVVTIEISKQGGLKINGESALVKYVDTASNPSNNSTESWTTEDLPTVFSGLWALNTIDFGGCQGAVMSNATYKYVKVAPLGWKEPVTPPSVISTLSFENVAYTTSYNGQGTANVTFTEMSDGTFPMTFVSESLNVNAENLTKGEDAKGRTTYTGTAKRTDLDVTFTVNAVVYGEAAAQKLYMTMDNGQGFVVTVGEDPDYVAPVTYKNTLKVVRGTDTKTYENAEVSVLAKGENKYAVTIPSFSDMDQNEGTIGKLTFEATGVEENGTLKLTATSAATTQEGGSGWDNFGLTASMDATVTGETLAGTFTVVYPGDVTNYTYTLYYGVEPPVTPEPEIEGTVVEGSKNYAANGSKFEWSNIAINWNKQKLVAVIDLSTCVGTNEDILSVGQNISAWQIGGWHFYYTKSENRMKSDYLTTGGAHPISDDNTPVEPGIVRIELSKAEGCTIDGVSFNGFYDSSVTGTWQSNTEDFWNLTSVNIGSKEGANRSNAVIKYVTVVDLPVTVKDEKTFNEVLYMNDQKVADATVVVKEMSDETINMSLQFSGYEYTSTELVKGTDEKNRTTYTGKVSKDSQTYDVAGVVYEKDNAERLYMTMTDTGVTFVVGENPDAVTPEVTEVSNKTYTSNLRILDGETTVVEEAEANVNIVKYSDESYKVTLKNVNMLNKTQDLVFVGTGLVEEASTEATEPLTIMAKSDEATTAFFGEEMNGTFDITEVSDDEIKMEFAIEGEGVLYEGEFNYEAKTPAAEPFCKENYVADGNGFEWEIPVDWDTQKIVMSIDPSTCTGNCEDVIGLGAVPTAWNNTLHLYRTRDQKLQGYFQVPGGNNNNTDKFAETVPFLVEVSKAQGFVVNDEVKIASSAMSYLFTLPTVKMGTGEGANDKSRATYNYVKVVDKDWTKDPETGINATTVAEGEFEVFSVDGVKLAKLQKGLNIVRSADGKVKKVLVK
ncbi:MAG: calycin-like domain-containing protein [Prevotella sp.]|nr:calycin-like domain-containing protein [Prevotella sp.]